MLLLLLTYCCMYVCFLCVCVGREEWLFVAVFFFFFFFKDYNKK